MKKQERPRIEEWISGFTDGEGCFSVSIFRNKTTKSGWQVFPEFVVTQGKKSLPALKIFQEYFGCGTIIQNIRYDDHREYLYRYCVRNLLDLRDNIVPFFQEHKLYTAKQKDFEIFADIVNRMYQKKHLTQSGMRAIARRIEKMNRKKKSQFLESRETKRHAPAQGGMKIESKAIRKPRAKFLVW